MIPILQAIHAANRWAIIVIAVAGIVHALLHLRGDGATRGAGKILGSVFLALLDIQLLAGAALLVLVAGVRHYAVPHSLLMLAAILVAHLLRLSAKKADAHRAGRLALSLYVGPLALITLGLTAVPIPR